MSVIKITVEVLVAADKEKVWKFYTLPKHITKWNFANNDWCCPKANTDLKVGGKYYSRMEAKDGSFGFDITAVYTELITEEKLTIVLEDGRHSTTTFVDSHGKTKVSITFDAENRNSIEQQKQGWQAILDNFKDYVESH